MKKQLLIAIVFLLFVKGYSQETQSKNEFLFAAVLKQLGLQSSDVNEQLYREKILPYNTTNTLMLLPKYRVNDTDSQGHTYLELDAYIVIAENSTGKILQKFVEEEAWVSDALVLTEITLDTGLYKLDDNNRAFGIRVSFTGSSAPNPYNYTDFSLFLIQNNKIHKILNNYKIDTFFGEWDTRCTGNFEEVTGVLTMDKSKSKGFNNLIVKNNTVKTTGYNTADGCEEKNKVLVSTRKLKYNGKEYK